MEMYAKKLLVSFTTIFVVFTSHIAYNHAEELIKAPSSSDISWLSPHKDPVFKPVGLGLNGWGRIPREPKLSHRASPHDLQLSSLRPPQQSEVEDHMFKHIGVGLNGWGRVPRVPKFSHPASSYLRIPLIRPPQPSHVEDPVLRPADLGLNGWGRVPRVPKFSQLRGSPPLPPIVWNSHLAVDPPFKPPSPASAGESSFKAPTSMTEPPSMFGPQQ